MCPTPFLSAVLCGVPRTMCLAVATVAAAGLPVPVCEEAEGYPDCQLGTSRALFTGTYILVGVPLFAFCLGQFSMVIVERAVRRRYASRAVPSVQRLSASCLWRLVTVASVAPFSRIAGNSSSCRGP